MTKPITIDASDNALEAALVAARAMLAALAETISPLIILGDHIGNTFPGGNGQPAFDRCAIINQVLIAIKAAEAAGITVQS